MLALTSHHQIHLAIAPIDFRKGINGLVALCQQQLSHDPFCGHVFVFCNRKQTAVKLLVYDGNGFWLCHKRFSKGRLAFWPKSHTDAVSLRASALQVLLQQGCPLSAALPSPWHPVHQQA